MLAQNWGNMQFGIREIEQRAGESTVQAFAWDVETNVRREVTFQVPHVRDTPTGTHWFAEGRDLTTQPFGTLANTELPKRGESKHVDRMYAFGSEIYIVDMTPAPPGGDPSALGYAECLAHP